MNSHEEKQADEISEKVNEAASVAAKAGALVEIVGAWVWATFSGPQPASVTGPMKEAGFKFSRRRARWYFAGVPSRGSRQPYEVLKAVHGSETYQAAA